MQLLKQNIGVTVMMFAGGTGLGPAASISKNGGAFAAAANTPAEVSNGWYSLLLSAGEVDTIGPLCVHLSAGTPADFEFQVGAPVLASVEEWRGAVPAALVGDLVQTACAAMANNVIAAAAINADATAKLFSGGALTEAYAADGAPATPAQLLYMIWSALTEFAIAGATLTCKRLDGSTTSMTFTLSPAGNPTARARSAL